jgi:hypothetical protein
MELINKRILRNEAINMDEIMKEVKMKRAQDDSWYNSSGDDDDSFI